MADSADLDAMRLLLDLLADKWTIPVLGALCTQGGCQRFNALRRDVQGVSQKSLSACLKRLEANGLVERHVATAGELAVEYRVTDLGHTLAEPVGALMRWSDTYRHRVLEARAAYAGKGSPQG